MQYKLQINGRFCTSALEDREFNFVKGLNFLSAKNGVGKSSLLRALTLALLDKAVGDNGNQASRPSGLYTLNLANHVFNVSCGRSEKEGLFFTGQMPLGELKGERQENVSKFLNWLEIKPNTAFDTLLERIQFDPASPSLFKLTERKLLDSVTSSLSERTKVYQLKFNNIKTTRDQLAKELEQAKREAQLLSGSECASTAEIEEAIKLEHAKINGRPEPMRLPYLERDLQNLNAELKALQASYLSYVAATQKQIDVFQAELKHTDFDENEVRSERDQLIKTLTNAETEIRRLQANVFSPKPCAACGTPLLEGKEKYIVADVAAIAETKQQIEKNKLSQAQAHEKKQNCDQLLQMAEIKRKLESLKRELAEKTAAHELNCEAKQQKIAETATLLKVGQEALPLWESLTKLEDQLKFIKSNNERYQRLQTQASLIEQIEKKFFAYDFHLNAGIRDLLYGHFVQQCSRFSKEVNEVLYACDLGQVEFIPEFDQNGNVEKIRLRHFDKGEWLPYEAREGSMKVMLNFAAWTANKNLNPKKVDELQLILLDDFGHIFSERLERVLNYLSTLPVVLLFAWANQESEKLFKPVQTIIL